MSERLKAMVDVCQCLNAILKTRWGYGVRRCRGIRHGSLCASRSPDRQDKHCRWLCR